MTDFGKKVTALVGCLVILMAAYVGSYLPLKRSELFIHALREKGNVRSLTEFEALFSAPLEVPSPIGREEITKNSVGEVMNIIKSQGKDHPELVKPLMDFANRLYAPIVTRGKGINFGQHLYLIGSLNEVAFLDTDDESYLDAAERYHMDALERGPRRPQPLYGMLNVSILRGDTEAIEQYARRILELWPDDKKIEAYLEKLEKETK